MLNPSMGQFIPDELKAARQWILWRREVRHGKPTKVPFDSRSGLPGSVTDPEIYLAFDRALAIALGEAFYEGIGFVVTEADPYVGVDLDNCLDESGVLEPWARPVVESLRSYTELTPSGRGLRVWIKGKLPPKGRRKGKLGPGGTGVIEFYEHERYFTVTGDRFARSSSEVLERQAELDAIHRHFWPEKEAAESARTAPGLISLSDRQICDRMFAARNGFEVQALFNGASTRHPSGSEADLALCSHLAFWCGGDVDTIDRIFRQSALSDAKWLDRPDYREATIAKALERSSFYDPNYGRHGAPGQGPARDPGGDRPPLPAGAPGPGREPGDDAADPDGAFLRTDKGNAMRLVAMHGGDLRYCHPWKSWLAWSGDRWKVDETGAVFRKAYDVLAQLHAEARAEADPDKKKRLVAWAMASEGDRKINAIVAQAKHQAEIPVMPSDFDKPPFLINCPNGTVDLKTGRLGPHVRGDLLTKRANAPFDAAATSPTWEAFLRRIMGDDVAMVDFLRRAVGYAATGSVKEHALFFLYGLGRNGKSTFLNTIQEVLGDYAITVNADLLTAKNQEDHPTGVADLQGRRFVATIEVEDGRRMAESLVKTLTGGDKIRARRMRENFFEFEPTHKLFLAANHKPVIKGTDDGIWRRIKLIPFKVQIPDAEVDKSLPDKLQAEAPGILAWVVRGCLEWQEVGLLEPEAVVEATKDYRTEMDYLGDFLEECCEVVDGFRCRSNDLYRTFCKWCTETGGHPPTKNKFGRMLTDRGFGIEKTNSLVWRLGLRVREEHLSDEPVPFF